ncbi:MAG: DMT family transporter [Lentisphaeria bacterium]|nr:DMT family transporter [Lentisphaeria bacterium]MDP7740402.1 DMT family transporter [Lentisphaeria bacterium]
MTGTATEADRWRGRLLILAAAVLWSTGGAFIKSPILGGIEPVAVRGPLLACGRTAFAALLLLAFRPWRLIRWRVGLLPLLFSFAAMNVLLVCSMTRAAAGDVIFLQYSAPLWVCVVAATWLREPLVKSNLIALVIGMSGVAVIVVASVSTPDWVGVWLALGSGVGYAGVILSLRALRDEDSIGLIFLCMCLSSLVLVPWVAGSVHHLNGERFLWLAIFSVVQIGVPYILFARGLRWVTAQEGSLITLLEPVLTPLWVLLLWRVTVAPHTIMGGGLILAALLVTLRPERPNGQRGTTE